MNVALLVALALLFAAEGGASAPKVSVRVPEAIKLVQGQLVETRVSVAVVEGYHLQANPASEDYLVPARLELKSSGGVTVSKITYPPGKPYRLNGADKDLKTYEGNFEISVLLKASSEARPGKHILQGRLHYQACDSNTCLFPTSLSLTLTVNVVATHQKSPQARGDTP
jgi:DsbC/DsbD-like thiol-disulfide interchange protein